MRISHKYGTSLLQNFAATTCLLLPADLCGQATRARIDNIDLAVLQPGKTDSVFLAAGDTVTPTVINLVIKKGYRYYLNVARRRADQPPFPVPTGVPAASSSRWDPSKCGKPEQEALKKLGGSLQNLDALEDELAVTEAIDRLQLDAADLVRSCSEAADSANKIVAEAVRRTTMQVGSYVIESETALEVAVTRTAPTATTETWKRVYSAPPKGTWRTGFGAAFITGYHTADRFYIDAADTVRASGRRAGSTFAPAVFYSWQAFSPPAPRLSPQIVAGLAFDLAHPIVTLGFGITFYDNVNVSGGLAAFEGDRLKSQYYPGVAVPAGTQQDDVFEKRYYAKPYVAVAFRFSSNPFPKPAAAPTTINDSKNTDGSKRNR